MTHASESELARTLHAAYRKWAGNLGMGGHLPETWNAVAEAAELHLTTLRSESERLTAELATANERIAALEAEREGGPINGPLRMYIALQALRAWNSGTEGLEALTVSTINQWLDDGMKGPIPWPDSPFFAEWAEKRGYANVGGNIGFRFTAELTDAARAGKAGE